MLQSALRHATRARVLGGTGLLGLSLTLARRGKPTASAGQDDAALGLLWGEALDGMIRVPGAEGLAAPNSVLYMAPTTAAAAATRRWPPPFENGPVFSLTAHNPMGRDAPAAQNDAANRRLHAELWALDAPAPAARWHSFGFNAAEGWREAGFSLAFAAADAERGRAATLGLARKYEQAAIYEYGVRDGKLYRTVVWCDGRPPDAPEAMEVVPPPDTPLARPHAPQ